MSFDPKSSTVVEGIDDEPVHKEVTFIYYSDSDLNII